MAVSSSGNYVKEKKLYDRYVIQMAKISVKIVAYFFWMILQIYSMNHFECKTIGTVFDYIKFS